MLRREVGSANESSRVDPLKRTADVRLNRAADYAVFRGLNNGRRLVQTNDLRSRNS